MAGRLQEFQNQAPEADFIAVVHRHMLQGRIRRGAQIDFRAGFRRQFHVATHEIGMQMSFNNVLDLEPLRARLV